MKKTIFSILSICGVTLLTGCAYRTNNSSDNYQITESSIKEESSFIVNSSDPNAIKEYTFSANFVFRHIIEEESGEYLAALLFDSNYLRIGEINYPSDLVAGDTLTIKYRGNLIIDMSYPGFVHFEGEGELISYSFKQTNIFDYTIEENKSWVDELSVYDLDNEYVIIDKQMHYVPLSEYTGDTVFLTENKEKRAILDDSSTCLAQRLPISGLYAFNPRD